MSQTPPLPKPDTDTSVISPTDDRTEPPPTLDLPTAPSGEGLSETLVPPPDVPHPAPPSTEALRVEPLRTEHLTGSGDSRTAPPSVPPSVTAQLSGGDSATAIPGTVIGHEHTPSPTDAPTQPRPTDHPASHPSRVSHSHAPLPIIPGYEVLGELGQGGMGVVYKARHRKLNRIVALKMIRAGGHVGSHALQRFQAEAEAVARFQHPNIVQVYEIGQHGEQPYFSLEFVDGGALSDLAGRAPQPPREAARLVQSLAEAMDYAHRHGILHRDLKPANVLLASGGRELPARAPGDARPPLSMYVPKITDFGLAKELEGDSGQTRDGAVMGTPSYMAPEQAQGKIKELGPPADVYALGAILYELLTGVPPFLGSTVVETLSQVVEREPLPPRRMQPNCPRDLQTICLKCLEKEARKRYASASELAEDLRRYCANEPILARPTPALERAWKWARRRPAAAVLIVVSVLALVGFGVGGVLLAREANERRETAEALASEEETRRREAEEHAQTEASLRAAAEREGRRAEANFKQARGAVQELTLIGHQGLAHEPRLEKLRGTLLRKALAFHEEFLRINGADPGRRRESAQAQVRVAEIEAMLGHQDPAEKAYRASIATYQDLLVPSAGDRELRLELAGAWNGLAILLQEARRPSDAGDAFREAVTLREKIHAEQADAASRFALASGYNDRGNYHLVNGRTSDAEQDYLRALPLAEQLHTGSPEDDRYRRQLAHTHFNLGAVWTVSHREKAEEAYGKALPLWEALREQTPEAPHYRQQLATTLLNRGTLRHLARRPREAENDYQRAATILTELADEYRAVPDYRRLLANADGNLGELLRDAERPRDAEKVWRRYVSTLASLAKEFPKEMVLRQRLGRGHNDLAIALFQLRRFPEAETAWREAIVVQQKLVDEQRTDPVCWQHLVESVSNLAEGLAAQSASDAAVKARRDLVAVQEKRVEALGSKPEHLAELADAQFALAQLLIERKEPTQARPALDGAVKRQQAVVTARPGDAKPRQALGLYSTALIELLLRERDHAAASGVVQQVLALPEVKGAADIISGEKAAAFLAQCIGLAEKDAEKKAYGDRAMEALRRAVQRGYKDRKALETGAEFATLRSRADFQELLRMVGG